MNEAEDVIERLTRQFDRVTTLREAAANDPALDAARRRLRAWQAARLARTYADLVANARMDLAAAFFLTDIYGSEDLSRLDANVRRDRTGDETGAARRRPRDRGAGHRAGSLVRRSRFRDGEGARGRGQRAVTRRPTEPRIARSTVVPIASGRSTSSRISASRSIASSIDAFVGTTLSVTRNARTDWLGLRR